MLPPRRERKRMFNEGLTGRRPIPEKKEPRESGSQEFNREASNRVAPTTRQESRRLDAHSKHP